MTNYTNTNAIQTDTIVVDGTYAITAYGAEGGGSLSSTPPISVLPGGLGAEVSGDIYLTAGTVLDIVVGGAGGNSALSSGGGGGGGSFVFENIGGGDIFLAVAGGGGGAALDSVGANAQSGPTGGRGGGPQGGGGGVNGAAGGGGVSGGGGGGITGGSAGHGGAVSGMSFAGGAGSNGGGGGGYGGGGGGNYYGGGGGGGYGGGGGGGGFVSSGGGGGGSYLAGDVASQSIQSGVTAPTSGGGGEVTITLVPCFLAGTHIRTPRGEVLVEALRAGEFVLTADGQAVPIIWIGARTVAARFAAPLHAFPIRIRAGALAENIPARDLLVSPDHAMFLDGILVQAGALVNGMSITREAGMPASFTYYHVEAADHALILAEGAPTETFVDNVDRMNFDNWAEHEALHADAPPIAELPYPRAKSARQVPASLRQWLALRAQDFGATAQRA